MCTLAAHTNLQERKQPPVCRFIYKRTMSTLVTRYTVQSVFPRDVLRLLGSQKDEIHNNDAVGGRQRI